MEFQHDGSVTTYEWAVRAYDSFPNQPTRLSPGKKIGLEIAVLDKDEKKPRSNAKPPSFRTWGAAPVEFKGCNAGLLGELILDSGPAR
jgi:hypothetical protein